MDGNAAPGFKRNPGHRIDIVKEPKRVRVLFDGETIADSGEALTLSETNHAPVHYLPRRDVRMDRLARTGFSSHCPYKGDASYYNLAVGGRHVENAVWSYEQPFDEMAAIKDYLAFYPDRVDAIEVK
jgi:uncharacterized protein (DUF427 family)